MGGKPSKGTKRDRRLKENKRRKTAGLRGTVKRSHKPYPTDKG
jgi:hypothetical protein